MITAPLAVPEGWSDPDEVDALYALGLLAGIPIALFLLITLAVYLPSMVRGASATESGSGNEWFGGRRTLDDIAEPDDDASKAGGASGQW